MTQYKSEIFSLEGRRVVLTGAAGHLGLSILKGLLAFGAEVIAIVRDEEKMRDTVGDEFNKLDIRQVDLSQMSDLDELVNSIENLEIHGIVNNAYYCPSGGFNNQSMDKWRQGIEGTLVIPALLMYRLVPSLIKTKGAVVNIASMYGMVSPDPRVYNSHPQFDSPPPYGAAKAGLIQLTKQAASYLGDKGVRVNSISPGPFPSKNVQSESEFIGNLNLKVPLGRIGNSEEMIGPVVFLLSDSSSYITGHNLVVDGGWTVT